MRNVGLVAIGSELLDGRYQELHTRTLGRALAERGARLSEVRIVSDEVAEIVGAIEALAERLDAVVVTGGLGATSDDLTRDAVARWLGVDLEERADEVARIQSAVEARGRTFGDGLRVHALVPAGAVSLGNVVGLATAFAVESPDETTPVLILPGVPREFDGLVDAALDHLGLETGEFVQRRIQLYGLPEREVQARIEGLELPEGFSLGLVPRGGPVEVSASGTGDADALAAWHAAACERLADALVSAEGLELPARVGQLLRERGETIATAESCTGGLIASMLTDVAGSSAYVMEAAVTYSNAAKMARLGVAEATLETHGAVSEATVREMAEGMRRVAGTTWTLAVSGIAGPGGGTPDKPVGTVHTAICGPAGTHWELLSFPGLPRAAVKRRTALAVLAHLCRRLQRSDPAE